MTTINTTNTGTNAAVFNTLWDAPMSTRGFLSFKADHTVSFNGLQHGKATIIGSSKVPGLGTVLVVHEEGTTYWSGRGVKPGYAAAQVHTILLDELASRFGVRYVQLHGTTLPKNAVERETRSMLYAQSIQPTTNES